MNVARHLTNCHGVSLEGGLAVEKLVAIIYQISLTRSSKHIVKRLPGADSDHGDRPC